MYDLFLFGGQGAAAGAAVREHPEGEYAGHGGGCRPAGG